MANDHNAVLVFDECTSGFRKTFGGLHKLFEVEPDMAMFGKALGNGYAITGVIGREAVMQSAQSTFISSTFWTERIGSVAGVSTLEVMEQEESWDKITRIGKYFQEKLAKLASEYGSHLLLMDWRLSLHLVLIAPMPWLINLFSLRKC